LLPSSWYGTLFTIEPSVLIRISYYHGSSIFPEK
jgi:hypothetical protein